MEIKGKRRPLVLALTQRETMDITGRIQVSLYPLAQAEAKAPLRWPGGMNCQMTGLFMTANQRGA